jgi:hypothetical protein
MPNFLTPMTELEAVNQILATVGETPVNSLENPGVSIASLAQTFLNEVSREVQSMGLHCNTEEEYPLIPDVDGFIYLPSNTLMVDASDRTMDVVQRGNRLYDRQRHSYVFSEPLKVDIVFFLPFSELPQVVRKYITIRTARQLQARWLSSDIIHRLTENDELSAWHALQAAEIFTGDYSILNSEEMLRILKRN